MIAWFAALTLACAPLPGHLEVEPVPTGVEIRTSGALPRVIVSNDQGGAIRETTLPSEITTHWLPVDWSGTAWVEVQTPNGKRLRVERPTTLDTVTVMAPLGQPPRHLPDGESLDFPVVGDVEPIVGIQVQTMTSGPLSIRIGEAKLEVEHSAAGQTHLLTAPAGSGVHAQIEAADGSRSITLRPRVLTPGAAGAAIQVEAVEFPTDERGEADIARPQQQISLASTWWTQAIQSLGLSIRPRDRTVPWAHQAVRLRNDSDLDLSVVVRSRVTTRGAPDPAFTPRMRDVDDGTGWVSAILLVPHRAHAEAVLPLFVQDSLIHENNRDRTPRVLEVEVSALGSGDTLTQYSEPLFVHRGSTAAAAGMAVGCTASIGGLLLIAARLRHWLRMPTTTLVTIALFGTLSFVVNAAMQLIGMGVAGLLGPFAFVLTGLFDDTLRALLLITLLTLRPRPGVCGMSVLIGWLLRAVTTGAASPADVLYLTGHLFLLESALWLFGLTRGRPLTSTRLAAAFIVTFTASITSALAFNVVLYRLFYADWYVFLNIGLSGIVYPALATFLAVPVARSLRRVED